MLRARPQLATNLPAMLAVLSVTAAAGAVDRVERRSALLPLEGRLTGFDDAGVTVHSRLGATHFVPWDRVRDIDTETPWPGLRGRLEAAVDLWRARSRVERHDTALAEAIFERLFETYRGQTHETALVVAEGLLRCRLDRADHGLAVVPLLEVIRLRRSKVATASYSMLPPILDKDRQLSPRLAPAWVPGPLLVTIERELGEFDAHGDEVVALMAKLYRRSIRRTLDLPVGKPPPDTTDHAGVRLLSMMIACLDDDGDLRQRARGRLGRAVTELPAWGEAWARLALGRSLIGESGRGRRQAGMVHLVHVPARFGRVQPYLAGLALANLAAALDENGDPEAAESMRAELQRSYPWHPAAADSTRIRVPRYRAGTSRTGASEESKEFP